MQAKSALFAATVVLALASRLHAQCGNSQGITPLDDLGAGFYAGFQGGLYAGGSNVPPAAHLADALAVASQVKPLDALGGNDPGSGLIGMISIGMSNTTHEYAVFERQEDLSTVRNPRVVIVTCSQGGQGAEDIQPSGAPYWTLVDLRVAAAGLTNAQVQVAWVKEAFGTEIPGFPAGALALQTALGDIVRNLKVRFPNLKLCYLSSRVYGGYSAVHGETIAFETGFAVKWLIEDQIGGDPTLNWDSSAGAEVAPLLLWGPYTWADGEVPRSDGLTWCPSDFQSDGTHPAPIGEQKVANMLSSFFAADPTAAAWWPNPSLTPLTAIDAQADATVISSSPTTNFGSDPTLRIEDDQDVARTYLRFDFSAVARPVVHAKLSVRNPENSLSPPAISARLVADTTWNESTITFASAPPPSGSPKQTPSLTGDGARSLDVTDWVNGDLDGVISIVLHSPTAHTQATLLHSREALQPPRLILSLNPGNVLTYCTAKPNFLSCVPSISGSGLPSASGPGPFVIATGNVLNNKNGLFFYGLNGQQAVAFQGGTLCVRLPVKRTPVQQSGGNPPPNDCSGSYAIDFNAHIAGGQDPALVAGVTVDGQHWSRDPGFAPPNNVGLSNAIHFVICP